MTAFIRESDIPDTTATASWKLRTTNQNTTVQQEGVATTITTDASGTFTKA
ncbi:MAG: hypothetical protein ACK4HE_07355 [Chitinophagaceae bacterium]|jgi:hypothetical protein